MILGPCFSEFKHVIAAHSFEESSPLPSGLRLWPGESGAHKVFYAPFEHQNRAPKIALIGITPGRTQTIRAFQAAKRAMDKGLPDEQCLIAAKVFASFGGGMRDDLVAMLDVLGVHNLIGESTTRNLWTVQGYEKAHFCSLLSFPTFKDGNDYNESPSLNANDAFRSMLEATSRSLNALPKDTLILPLGSTVLKTLVKLQKKKLLTRDLLSVDDQPICLPHPSGQNAESIELVLDWQYDNGDDYAAARRERYLIEQPWKKRKGGTPQSEEAYKSCRISRWASVCRLRAYFDCV